MDYGLNTLFPTPMLLDKVANTDLLNEVIQELLLTINLASPPSDFQKYDVLREGSPVIQEFKNTVVIPTFEKYLNQVCATSLTSYTEYWMKSWVTGTGYDYVIPVHNHSGASVSAVFYLLCEEQDKGGKLMMIDPRPNANRGYDINFKPLFEPQSLLPKTGDIAVFPSFLYHYSTVFKGKLRLAMPVDLFVSADTWNLY